MIILLLLLYTMFQNKATSDSYIQYYKQDTNAEIVKVAKSHWKQWELRSQLSYGAWRSPTKAEVPSMFLSDLTL